MAYTVKLGTFAKKINSTAQPDMTGWAEYNVTLKNGSELTAPVLDLKIEESDIVNYNYAYFLGSYYWITSRTMARHDLCSIKLEKDVLASYKDAIGNSNLYIVRSSVSFDGSIKDSYYPMLTSRTVVNTEVLDSNDVGLSSGCYVVNIIGKTTASSTLYLMTPSEFSSFLQALYAVFAGYVGLNFDQAVSNALLEPMEYIRSVIWLPFSYATASTAFGAISTNPNHVFCGLWDSGVESHYITKCADVVGTWSIPLNKHPQSYRGGYLNGAPYTEHIIDFMPFGVIHVNADKLITADNLNIQLIVDATTGMGILQAAGDNGSGVLVNVSAQYGVPIPLSGAASNFSAVSSMVSGIGGLVGGIATGNPFMAIAGAAQGIASAGDSIRGVVSSSGSCGSMAAYQVNKVFYTLCYNIADEDNVNNGRPLCQLTNPALLGGYMVAEKAPLSISATAPELEQIQNYLTSGFYYE